MKILVTGSNGQLGRALQKVLPKNNSIFATKKDLNITDKKQVAQQIKGVRPNYVIHTAAYTDVDGCEQNKELAYKINVLGTKNIAEVCQKTNIALIYISTDFVFVGKKKTAYLETDKPNPLSVYGKTKLEGEEVVKKLPKYFIVRTAWLFGDGHNFVKTILNLAPKQNEIKVVSDQIGPPTYALDLAKAIYKLINELKIKNYESGIFHITNDGETSWANFAKEIVKQKKDVSRQSRGVKTKIIPISAKVWQKIKPESAPRPKYSVLSNEKIQKLDIKMRPWQEGLSDYLRSF